MSGSRHPVGGGVKAADDGRRIIIPGAEAGESSVFGVWGGYGVAVAVSPHTDAAWEGSGRETALGNHGPRKRSTNLQDGFPNHGGPEELSRLGVSGMVSDADSDEGPLTTPECLGNRDHTVGWQTPPPTLPPVWHVGALEGAKQSTYYHFSVRQEGVTKDTADGGRGDVGYCGEGLSGIR